MDPFYRNRFCGEVISLPQNKIEEFSWWCHFSSQIKNILHKRGYFSLCTKLMWNIFSLLMSLSYIQQVLMVITKYFLLKKDNKNIFLNIDFKWKGNLYPIYYHQRVFTTRSFLFTSEVFHEKCRILLQQ